MNGTGLSSSLPVIILAERDALARDMLSTALQRLNVTVITVADGENAYTKCLQHPPRLLITDIWLPRLNGLDLIRRLKENRVLHPRQVIIISALGFPEVVAEAAALGLQDFLVKPVNTDQFLERIRRHLGEDNIL
ncbi:MAG: response regulator [Thermanaerothrix sp.]|uniref:response regulator n=1 Tax=Thermanaerothrix sp. TaxID=2972675 RepID=UPI003C7A36FC